FIFAAPAQTLKHISAFLRFKELFLAVFNAFIIPRAGDNVGYFLGVIIDFLQIAVGCGGGGGVLLFVGLMAEPDAKELVNLGIESVKKQDF
ncbi:hypothetical protein BZK24_08695, partial [Helicobacter pylori]